MLISPAYAQTTAPATASPFAAIIQFAPLILIAVVFYFLLIRPQQTQQKTLKAALAALKRGDRVVTAGGILGTVKKTGETELDVEIAPNVTVSVVRSTISRVVVDAGRDAPS